MFTTNNTTKHKQSIIVIHTVQIFPPQPFGKKKKKQINAAIG